MEGLGANERTRHPALQAHVVVGGEAPDKEIKILTFIRSCVQCKHFSFLNVEAGEE